MLYGQGEKAVFSYAYTPTIPLMHERDGGFVINLFETDMLSFECKDLSGQILSEQVFAVPPEVRMRLIAMIQSNGSWLSAFPTCMRTNTTPKYTSHLGLDGYPLFLMQELPSLMECPFRSVRGHYARTMYNFLEDVSSLFYMFGFNLTLEGFTWDQNVISPRQMPLMLEQRQVGYA